MKNNLIILITVMFSFLSYSSNAQESNSKNYLLSNISYSFFGTGDLSGSAVGITYHRMFFDNFGANISYSKATARGKNMADILEDYQIIENVTISGEYASADVSLYNSLNLGLTYRTTAGSRHALLAGAGFNYKSVNHNYLSSIHYEYNDHTATATINGNSYNSSKEVGFYLSLDYLFFVARDFAVGIHGAYESSPNVLSNAGISLGYRF